MPKIKVDWTLISAVLLVGAFLVWAAIDFFNSRESKLASWSSDPNSGVVSRGYAWALSFAFVLVTLAVVVVQSIREWG